MNCIVPGIYINGYIRKTKTAKVPCKKKNREQKMV